MWRCRAIFRLLTREKQWQNTELLWYDVGMKNIVSHNDASPRPKRSIAGIDRHREAADARPRTNAIAHPAQDRSMAYHRRFAHMRVR